MKFYQKFIFITFLFSFLSIPIFSQECGTDAPTEAEMQALPYYGNNAWFDTYVDSLTNTFNNCTNCRVEGNNEVWYRVPVKFYVWSWQGQNALERNERNTDKALKAMMHSLNDAMRRNNVPIRFYMLCPSFPENEKAATGTMDKTDACNFRSNNYTQGALNCHIFNDPSVNGRYCGRSDNNIIIWARAITQVISEWGEGDDSINNSTFVHEVGHWLGLNHTHKDEQNRCDELVTRDWVWSICRNNFIYTRQCELRADALCDTEADPNLDNYGGFINDNCEWTGNIKDIRGDLLRPNPKNYMAYGARICRSIFTWQQRAVMLRGINQQSGVFNIINANNDFDMYEPDNNAPASSLLRFNEPQIHSFSNIGSCDDDDDWVKFNYPQSQAALEDMYLELENVEGYNNPVLELEFWNGGNGFVISPELANRETYKQVVTTPTKITYTIPCNLTTNRTYLFRVVRNGNQTGRYKLTLKKKTPQLFGDRTLCLGIPKTYILDNIPSGATINWQVSRNIRIVSGQGTNAVTVVSNNFGEGTIGATITGCNNTYAVPSIPIIMGVSQVFPVTYAATPTVGQTITFTIQKPLPLNVDAYTYQLFVNPQSTNQYYNWSLLSYVDTGTHIEMSVRVGLGSAEIGMEVNSCNQIVARPNIYVEGIPDPNCYYGLRVSPNPTKDFISISRTSPEPCIGLRAYQGKLYNKFNKIVWQGEIKEDIQIDARRLPNDVYFLHLVDEKGNTQKQQIILNK